MAAASEFTFSPLSLYFLYSPLSLPVCLSLSLSVLSIFFFLFSLSLSLCLLSISLSPDLFPSLCLPLGVRTGQFQTFILARLKKGLVLTAGHPVCVW